MSKNVDEFKEIDDIAYQPSQEELWNARLKDNNVLNHANDVVENWYKDANRIRNNVSSVNASNEL